MAAVLVHELVQVAAGAVFEVVAGAFLVVGFEGVQVDDVGVGVWEDVLEHEGLDRFGGGGAGVLDCLADDEVVGNAGSKEVDDAFAVEADLRDEFVFAGFGRRSAGDAALG